MAARLLDSERIVQLRRAATMLAVGATLLALVSGALLAALAGVVCTGLLVVDLRQSGAVTLTGGELDRLREAELALAGASDTGEAARALAEQTLDLLGARTAVVLIEGIGDTVRVTAGPDSADTVYGSGSRMRLLDDGTHPCGSIAVSARADGRPYTERDERVLDALAERISSTLHQLSLLEEVQRERRTLADLIGSSSDGIFSVGSDLRVRSWNPAMTAITGVAAAKALGEHVGESFRPHHEDGTPATGKADPGRRGEATPGVLLRLESGGEVKWLTCSYAPLTDGGYVVVVRDDTERKKLQDDKDGWIAQVSHELRTPLTPIKGFLHTLSRREESLTSDDRRKIYEIMLREEQRLENLVDALLRSTQLEQGGIVVDRVPVDWSRCIDEQIQLLRRQDPARSIVVRGDHPGVAVLGDRTLAVGIVSNLLSNAVKYADGGDEIVVEVVSEDDEVVTRVIDHGPGIPRSDRERIFDKFTRLGDHLTRPQQGVGLGLHIVKQSLELLDGSIWVEDTPGGGATFAFSLPVSDELPTEDGTDGRAVADDGSVSSPRSPRARR